MRHGYRDRAEQAQQVLLGCAKVRAGGAEASHRRCVLVEVHSPETEQRTNEEDYDAHKRARAEGPEAQCVCDQQGEVEQRESALHRRHGKRGNQQEVQNNLPVHRLFPGEAEDSQKRRRGLHAESFCTILESGLLLRGRLLREARQHLELPCRQNL